MARKRKNAIFTLDGDGDPTLIRFFYRKLDELYPGTTRIPIPPESHIHPKHYTETQNFIFVDFAVRKIAPIALRAARLEALAADLERLNPLIDLKSATSIAVQRTLEHSRDAASNAPFIVPYFALEAVCSAQREGTSNDNILDDRAMYAADFVADAAYHAASLNPTATWAAVNEMLQAL